MAEKTWTWAFVGTFYNSNLDRMIEACHACDVKAMELHPSNVEGLRDAELVELRQRLDGEGISVSSFHLPYAAPEDIASFYEFKRSATVARMSHWMRIAGKLGARVVVQHPTTDRDPAVENGLDRYFEQIYRSLDELVPVARESGVIIGLENMTPGESGGGRFFSEPEHIARLSREYTAEEVGFVYDTGHALYSAGSAAIEILEAMGQRVAAWHLADNAGDRDSHLAPGRGEVDWDGVFRFAARIGFSHPITMETAPWGPGPDYSLESWKNSVLELEALVEKALA